MANEVKLWESFDDVLAHREQWDQEVFITGKYTPGIHFAECGTTQCIAGFRGLRDGLIPVVDCDGFATTSFIHPDGSIVNVGDYAAQEFELNPDEEFALFGYLTDDPADLKDRIEKIIAGKWADVGNKRVNP